MELSLLQVELVGIAASVVTQGLRLLANRFGWSPNLEQTNIGLFVVAAALGLGFFGLPEVSGSDPAVFAESLVAAAAQVVGAAVLSYNILLKKVLRPAE
jgi:hypothetical protein